MESAKEFAKEHPRSTVALGAVGGMVLGIFAEVARRKVVAPAVTKGLHALDHLHDDTEASGNVDEPTGNS